jgi:hypothetical protein
MNYAKPDRIITWPLLVNTANKNKRFLDGAGGRKTAKQTGCFDLPF